MAVQAQQAVLLPTFYSEDTPASANETWARLHSDPLFAVSLEACLLIYVFAQHPDCNVSASQEACLCLPAVASVHAARALESPMYALIMPANC